MSTLQREAPEHAGLGAAWMVFVAAMQERIAAALVARDWPKAEDGLAALADAPNGASAGEPLRAQLATAKLEEHYLAVATPAGELELLERATPVYPVEAARSGTEGWVEIEFVVDVTGQTRDLEVVAAEPRGEFEKAALAALAEYRYRPFARDGHVVRPAGSAADSFRAQVTGATARAPPGTRLRRRAKPYRHGSPLRSP